uniref:Expressed conserved protein n=1 Tax=Echinococcus granulosus TaxID=6210 RepID=A0A068WGL5_ECHGR|nr:hypothetical protein EgrG_000673900 [Echinococcus granulosus]
MIPTVDSKGEGKKRSNGLEAANGVSEIGDVCQQLKKCVTSVQNRIMDSLLPSLVVMGNFGESGHRDEFKKEHHFKNLQTVILETSFTEKLKSFTLTSLPEHEGGDRDRIKFLLLPQWEQRILTALWRREKGAYSEFGR